MHTLLLNYTYKPLRVITLRRALKMIFKGKVEVIEEYSEDINLVSFAIKAPSIIRLLHFVKRDGITEPRFSRYNIFARDEFECQYCGKKFCASELTWDHIIPRRLGGESSWENVVTSCVLCNSIKGGRCLGDCGLKLRRKPVKPRYIPYLFFSFGIKKLPETWLDYIYWNITLGK